MTLASDLDFTKFTPDNKNQADLEQDQRDLIAHFEHIEGQILELKNAKKERTHKAEIKKLMSYLIKIETAWKNSRQMVCQMQNVPYEEMGIMQYRMMQFLEKRRSYREKLEKKQTLTKDIDNESIDSDEQKGNGKKNKRNLHKQIMLTAFIGEKKD